MFIRKSFFILLAVFISCLPVNANEVKNYADSETRQLNLELLKNFNENNNSEVIRISSLLIEKNPTYWQYYFARAKAYIGISEFYNALKDYDIVISLSPTNYVTYYKRGILKLIMLKFKSKVYGTSIQEIQSDYRSVLNDMSSSIYYNTFQVKEILSGAYAYRGLIKKKLPEFKDSNSCKYDLQLACQYDAERCKKIEKLFYTEFKDI